jgi:hypothetical protein
MSRFLSACAFLFSLALLAGCGGQGENSALSNTSSIVPAAGGSTTSGGGTTTGSGGGTTASSGGGSTTGIPANAKVISDIQRMPNWESCTDCANGASATYSMTEGISSPSLSGSSAQFSLLNGTAPWGQALWWKYLTRDDSATHFVYDLYFYLDNPKAAQALEFSVSQSVGGNRYEFATQCAMASEGRWRVWDPAKQAWANSNVSCAPPGANAWHHLTGEFERNSSNQVVFDALTLDGNRGEVNMTMAHQSDSSNGLDVSFQMDAKDGPILYSVWLDKISLTYW